ncbi:zinc transporter [Skermanella stibiiresistens SB22]|uniref:High-affinity zinc uptake system membrane protein ZnuB n=1 Tax=Skermanella stibiiresistens SB22 TaxID=1385369 RepID=W9H731_9PROT|nr:zinc ABC transporter permease subunit ZnuB [Skermanella stibiiresistens]EWY40507.1 zinc transporter [Skermanella stibiiresistens SB22]
MDDFMIRALLGGCGIALVAGPLGSFVVWRRMAYFGDTLSHSALLGIALGYLLGIGMTVGVIAVCVAIAVLLVVLQEQRQLASDTLLGIVSHSTLSLGLVAIAFMETMRIDLLAYLFGDILSVTTTDIGWIYGGGAVALGVLAFIWRRLLAITVDEDLARVEGMPVIAIRLTFMLLIAAVIAIAMKIVGILLITSLLIVPAATARRFSSSPELMAVMASVIGVTAVVAGLFGSLFWDLPSGPSIVTSAALMFALSLMVPVFPLSRAPRPRAR